jgi:hypothetical protein
MINIKARRISDNDLLAFCNELNSELGGGGKNGLKFGVEKGEDGTETVWLFGKKIQLMGD